MHSRALSFQTSGNASTRDFSNSRAPMYLQSQINSNMQEPNYEQQPPGNFADPEVQPLSDSNQIATQSPPQHQPEGSVDTHEAVPTSTESKAKDSNDKANRKIEIIGYFGFCCYLSFLLLVAGALAPLIVYHFTDKTDDLSAIHGALNYLANNINAAPLMNLSLVPSSSPCPLGSELIKLGLWPGTSNGCFCSQRELLKNFCDRDSNNVDCQDISGTTPMDLVVWDNWKWCGTRAKFNTEYIPTTKCPSDFRMCSNGTCIKNTLSCPITSISYTNTSVDISSTAYGSSYITLYRESQGDPLIDVSISLNNLPCFSSNKVALGSVSYRLAENQPTGCGKYGIDTQNSFEISVKTQEQVMKSNTFPASIYDLPLYLSILQSSQYYLVGRKKVAVADKEACRNIDTEAVQKSKDATDSLINNVGGSLKAAGILHGIIVIFTVVGIALNYWDKKVAELWIPSQTLLYYRILLIAFAMEIIIFIFMIIMTIKNRSVLVKNRDYFKGLEHTGCFWTAPAQIAVADYDDIVGSIGDTTFKYSVIVIVAALVTYVALFSILFYIARRKLFRCSID